MSDKSVAVLYLDLDQTVRVGPDGGFCNAPDDVSILPGALERMQEWKADGGRIAAVSNQGGIALGYQTMDAVAAVMMQTQTLCEGMFDIMVWCRHHPDADTPEMAQCWCRKPRAGMIFEAASGLAERFPGEMYPPHMALMVGDRFSDRQAAENANVRYMDQAYWRIDITRSEVDQ